MAENNVTDTPKVKKKHYRDMSVLVKEMKSKDLESLLTCYYESREVDGVVYTLHENIEAVFTEVIAETERRSSRS